MFGPCFFLIGVSQVSNGKGMIAFPLVFFVKQWGALKISCWLLHMGVGPGRHSTEGITVTELVTSSQVTAVAEFSKRKLSGGTKITSKKKRVYTQEVTVDQVFGLLVSLIHGSSTKDHHLLKLGIDLPPRPKASVEFFYLFGVIKSQLVLEDTGWRNGWTPQKNRMR